MSYRAAIRYESIILMGDHFGFARSEPLGRSTNSNQQHCVIFPDCLATASLVSRG